MIDLSLHSRVNKKLLVIMHDIFMITLAWLLAWWTRFNFDLPYQNWKLSIGLIPVLLLVQGVFFWRFRLYRALWRFASLLDLWNIFRAVIVGGLVAFLILFVFFRLEGVPRSVLLLYPLFAIFLLGGPRLAYRLWMDSGTSIFTTKDKKRVLIIGAGCAGDMLVRDMHRRGDDIPAAILDDNESLIGAEIHGVKICGVVKQINEAIEQFNIDWLAIAIPSASKTELQIIVEICEQTNLPIWTLPDISEMNSNQDVVSGLREVSIEDLLGREQVELDWQNIQNLITNNHVLVTGGGGSIGSVLCQQILELSPAMLIVVDHSEYNLYQVEQELSITKSNVQVIYVLGDICDKSYMKEIFGKYKPRHVFHAAAYKHVPILEAQPRQAIKNNISGTKTILDICCENNVEKFVLISTDKAVNPSNILGVSKRIAELYTEALNYRNLTQGIIVRFGNVLDSAGSVVPLFRKQIKQGGPVTVTHPDITRFFMTISEAAQLILQAASMGDGGEIFVLDMGEPVRIQYLAEQMILLSGKKVNQDIAITYCGLRPGEKLYEELFYLTERQNRTMHEKVFLARHAKVHAERCANEIDKFIENEIDSGCAQLNDDMFKFLGFLEKSAKNVEETRNVISILK